MRPNIFLFSVDRPGKEFIIMFDLKNVKTNRILHEVSLNFKFEYVNKTNYNDFHIRITNASIYTLITKNMTNQEFTKNLSGNKDKVSLNQRR